VFGVKGRIWICDQRRLMPVDEQHTVDACLRQIDFVQAEIDLVDKEIAKEVLASEDIRRLMTLPGVSGVTVERSPPRLLTAAARGGLRPPPARRPRRATRPPAPAPPSLAQRRIQRLDLLHPASFNVRVHTKRGNAQVSIDAGMTLSPRDSEHHVTQAAVGAAVASDREICCDDSGPRGTSADAKLGSNRLRLIDLSAWRNWRMRERDVRQCTRADTQGAA
jgi:hypothetical protein